eukprot:CAMPEP_0119390304 /NCGR_PEP_ID=MMETSP1334-20130426/112803_1 /TAXON_ID=127549 /ORGANISM="Calcidiscus leptoporus, Strain RCC1130" /LENGTH=190 /DNA_ID=CAMNT_0007412755 /DNA_START=137 /DNA_END=705 /DNA_ORIENTATION=+
MPALSVTERSLAGPAFHPVLSTRLSVRAVGHRHTGGHLTPLCDRWALLEELPGAVFFDPDQLRRLDRALHGSPAFVLPDEPVDTEAQYRAQPYGQQSAVRLMLRQNTPCHLPAWASNPEGCENRSFADADGTGCPNYPLPQARLLLHAPLPAAERDVSCEWRACGGACESAVHRRRARRGCAERWMVNIS